MKKVKPNLITSIILIVLAIIVAILGVVFMNNTPKGCPVKVTSRITFTQTADNSGLYELKGKIKNISDKVIVINDDTFTLDYKTPDGSRPAKLIASKFATSELEPGQELDLSSYGLVDDEVVYTNSNMTAFKITVDNATYNITSNVTTSIILFFFAGLFAIVAIISLVSALTLAKAQNKVIEYAASTMPDALVLKGTFTNKKNTAKNIGKSVASAMGGALSAAFLGVGSYRVYGNSVALNFVIGTDKIYGYSQADKKPSPEKPALLLDSEALPQVHITNKNDNVILESVDKSVSITFKTKKSGVSVEQLTTRLNEIFTQAPISPKEDK